MSPTTWPGGKTVTLPAGCLPNTSMPTTPSQTRHRHIILIGLMGCGKTTVGRELSKKLGMPFLDTDSLIEEQIGKSIPAIFEEDGEAHFRMLETTLLRYLVQENHGASYVVSTGGGIVVRPENRELLRQLGYNVWLNVELPVLLQRTARAGNRPLLHHPDPEEKLRSLLEIRRPLYAETAHARFDTSEIDVHDVVQLVKKSAEHYFRQQES